MAGLHLRQAGERIGEEANQLSLEAPFFLTFFSDRAAFSPRWGFPTNIAEAWLASGPGVGLGSGADHASAILVGFFGMFLGVLAISFFFLVVGEGEGSLHFFDPSTY